MSNQLTHTANHQYTLFVKRAFAGWLKEFFSNRSDFTYIPRNERDTGIMIMDKHAFNLEKVASKPALIIHRKQFNWMRTSIDQSLHTSTLTGTTRKMDLLQGSVIIHCLNQEGLVAEELAHIVFFGLEAFKSSLRKLGLWELQTLGIGEESVLVDSKSQTEIVSVPVIVRAFIQAKWLEQDAGTQLPERICVVPQDPGP
jgi:hypothetical protein